MFCDDKLQYEVGKGRCWRCVANLVYVHWDGASQRAFEFVLIEHNINSTWEKCRSE